MDYVKNTEDLKSWMASESKEFNEFIFRLLASLPGGEEVEDLGYKPFDWLG